MTINSPREALEAILTYCAPPPSTSGAPRSEAHATMANTVATTARQGLEAPYVSFYPAFDMQPAKAGGVGDALEQIRVAATEPGRHYLPSPWVRAMAQQGLDYYRAGPPAVTPVQAKAPELLQVALEHEKCLLHMGSMAEEETAALRVLLDPLRPLPPVPPAIAALLTQAREEQVIDGQQLDELRDLARRLAK